VTEYRIITNPRYPIYDPYRSWFVRLLGLLRIVQRPRYVVMHGSELVMWCNPANVSSVTKLLDRQGFRYTVGPALQSVQGGKS